VNESGRIRGGAHFSRMALRHSAAALHRRQARIRFSPVFIQIEGSVHAGEFWFLHYKPDFASG
jgi:hypothetical protein